MEQNGGVLKKPYSKPDFDSQAHAFRFPKFGSRGMSPAGQKSSRIGLWGSEPDVYNRVRPPGLSGMERDDYTEELLAGSPSSQLVILVHGINTRALWMGEVKPALEKAGFVVAPTSYGKFGVLRFLSPFSWSRGGAISRVARDIRTARRTYKKEKGREPECMSVIAHSFGTYIISRILTDHPEFDWHRVVFCGSVVREDFPFDQVLDRFKPPLLNEIGTKDVWPALAESAGWGYGSVGSTGFNRPPVETRWHQGFTHSDFLTESFCDTFWTPFLRGDKPKRADKAAAMPFRIRALTWLPLRWAPIALICAIGFFPVRVLWEHPRPFALERAAPATQPPAAASSAQKKSACEQFPTLCDTGPETLASQASGTNKGAKLQCFNGLGDCPPVPKPNALCFNSLGDCPDTKR